MYPDLETNIPRSLMRFCDFEFADDTALFPTQEQIKLYLQRYAREVEHCILFSHNVSNITRHTSHIRGKWTIEGRRLDREEVFIHSFDAVVLASGHQRVPRWPQVKGFELWSQRFPQSFIHSKDFRSAERFRQKVFQDSRPS